MPSEQQNSMDRLSLWTFCLALVAMIVWCLSVIVVGIQPQTTKPVSPPPAPAPCDCRHEEVIALRSLVVGPVNEPAFSVLVGPGRGGTIVLRGKQDFLTLTTDEFIRILNQHRSRRPGGDLKDKVSP